MIARTSRYSKKKKRTKGKRRTTPTPTTTPPTLHSDEDAGKEATQKGQCVQLSHYPKKKKKMINSKATEEVRRIRKEKERKIKAVTHAQF